jgi:hypothetical protein
MKPNKKQLNEYIDYLDTLEFIETFKSAFADFQDDLKKNVPHDEQKDLSDDEYLSLKELANLKFEDILEVESDTDLEYNDEGGHDPVLIGLQIITELKTFTIYDYEENESFLNKLYTFSEFLYNVGTVQFDEKKPPFNLEIIE